MKKENANDNLNEEEGSGIFNNFEEPIVSLFENCFSTIPQKCGPLRKFLLTKKFKDEVEAYRKSNDEKEQKRIKQNLVCVTPSGTFSERKESLLISHSQLICIDIDSKDNRDIDLEKSKHIIGQHCPSLYYAGLSLGGEGIFLILRISNPEYHKQHFDAIAYYLRRKFGLNVDTLVKSPASLRVVSYDENPYYNPNPIPFQYQMETKDKSAHIIRTVAEKAQIYQKVKRAVDIICEHKIDITEKYEHWFKIGCALAHEFGEYGRHWFHMISRMYEGFGEPECDTQYNKCLKYKSKSGVTIATFFYICKKHGIKW
ncbi:PriCT-2 domain-containing protein [Paludibacter sp. 221]|uniref:PriCT-2 domain-containing protein n=1 Tax=Paludibacter sp. 221 TaxID=2302939 RepID=UPI0013D4B45A|nr:PriCT-2 domain-containing protein [Paludibacter sp. 221]